MVYFISDLEKIKIGFTKQNVNKRLRQLNTGSPKQLYLLGYIEGDKNLEKYLHIKFDKYKVRNNGEWFIANQEIIEYINTNNLLKNTYIDIDNDKINILFKMSACI